MNKPAFRCPTRKAIDELAKELQLKNDPGMQDWEWEVANPDDIEKYIFHYKSLNDSDKKFTLMEIMIQAVEDQGFESDFTKYWNIIEVFLRGNFSIHQHSIFYWSTFDNEDLNECWKVTPLMRNVWAYCNVD